MTQKLNGYLAIVLDKDSSDKLKALAVHPKVYAHHLTIAYQPSEEIFKKYKPALEREITVSLVGMAVNEKGQAALAQNTPTENKHSHITISCAPDTPPNYSNELLEKALSEDKIKPLEIKVKGVVKFINF